MMPFQSFQISIVFDCSAATRVVSYVLWLRCCVWCKIKLTGSLKKLQQLQFFGDMRERESGKQRPKEDTQSLPHLGNIYNL